MCRIRKKFFSVFNEKEKTIYVGVRFLSVVGSILDMLSVSLVVPLVYFIVNKNDNINFKNIIITILPDINDRQYLMIVVFSLIIIFILKNLFLSFECYVQSSFTNKCKKRIKKQLYDSYLFRSYEELAKYSSGEIISIINENCDESFLLIYRYLIMSTEITVAIVIFVYLLFLDYKMTFTVVIILIVEIMLIFKIIDPIIKKISHDNYKYGIKVNSWVNQTFDGIKEVKISNRINHFSSKFYDFSERVTNAETKYDFLSSLPRNIIEAVSVSCMLLYIFVYININKDISVLIPHLSAFAVAIVRLLPSFNRISNSRSAILFYEKKLDSIIEQLNISKTIKNKEQCEYQISFNDGLEMKDVSFKYINRDDYVIKNGQLEIKYGSFVGIVGMSGVGKTTLVDILLGLLKPQDGMVLSDGKNVDNCYYSWISNIGYIPQNIFIMNSSIKENVGFGLNNDEIDENKVIEALKKAQLFDFVMSLPNGLDTIIGEKGIGLSGGQKQRIGIARALYNDPKILIFDEATSSLDNETEREIMQSISQFHHKKTLIVISHRLSTIENCDVIYRIEDKRIYRDK